MLNSLIDTASLLRRGVARLGTFMGYAAGWCFIATSALITFDVLARRFLGFSTQATTELSGYALAFGIAWGLAHTLSMRAHVRIDVGNGAIVTASITNEAVDELGLAAGKEAYAVVKASDVMIAVD